MKTRIIILIITILYPLWQLLKMQTAFTEGNEIEAVVNKYRISIWICWVVFAAVAVSYKWTKKNNFFFIATYAFIIAALVPYGFYYNKLLRALDITTSFNDSYTAGVLVALQDGVVLVALTVFLQVSVWWFTQRQHRE